MTEKFQSLFCWIRPLNAALLHFPLRLDPGFNPCSVGFGPSTVCQSTTAASHNVSILVLLDSAPQPRSTW